MRHSQKTKRALQPFRSACEVHYCMNQSPNVSVLILDRGRAESLTSWHRGRMKDRTYRQVSWKLFFCFGLISGCQLDVFESLRNLFGQGCWWPNGHAFKSQHRCWTSKTLLFSFCYSLLLEDSHLIHLILRVALGARGIKRTVSWWEWDLKANYQAINCVEGNQWRWDLGLNLMDPTWRAQSGVPFPANLNVTPPAFCLTREGRRGLVVIIAICQKEKQQDESCVWNLLSCENSWLFGLWSDLTGHSTSRLLTFPCDCSAMSNVSLLEVSPPWGCAHSVCCLWIQFFMVKTSTHAKPLWLIPTCYHLHVRS